MKSIRHFTWVLMLGLGLAGAAATAQTSEGRGNNAQVEPAVLTSNLGGTLRLADWDDHRRCDGDHDRDDRGCYYRDRDGRYRYYGYSYYGNRYAVPYYYTPYAGNGWYDRDGRWHEYKVYRHKKHHHDDDDDRW